jgi:hypothetical protein
MVRKMKTPEVENLGNMGVSGAGEGAFTPTPSETAQIRKVWIDLSDLGLVRKTTASAILRDILRNYKAKILVLVEFGDQFRILNDFFGIAKSIFAEEENDEMAIEKVAKELDEKRYLVTHQHISIIMLYTGDETAVAFVESTEDIYTIEMVRE